MILKIIIDLQLHNHIPIQGSPLSGVHMAFVHKIQVIVLSPLGISVLHMDKPLGVYITKPFQCFTCLYGLLL